MPACWDCADCALKLRPGHCLSVLTEWYAAGSGCVQDPTFKSEFDGAIKVWHSLRETGAVAPRFSPSASIFMNQSYGLRVSQDFGLVTEGEYKQLLGSFPSALPKSKALKPVSLPFLAPNSNTNFFVLDLQGADPQITQGMRVASLYFDTNSQLAEAVLEGAQQLSQEQGNRVFDFVTTSMNERRPQGLKPSAKSRPKTIQQLLNDHDLHLESQAEPPAATTTTEVVDCKSDDDDGDDDGPAAGSSTDQPTRSAGFNLPQTTKTASKKKAKPFAATAAATNPSAPSPSPVPAPTGRLEAQRDREGPGGDGRSESTVKNCRNSKADKEGVYQKLDPGMRRVADKYLEVIPNATVRSLEHLDPKQFLLQPSKQLSNSVTGVRLSVD